MLLPKHHDEEPAQLTNVDCLSTVLFLVITTIVMRWGGWLMRNIIFAPDSALHTFFTTPREADELAVGVVLAIVTTAVILALLTFRYSDWIRHQDGPADAKFRRWQVLNVLAYATGRIVGAADIRLDGNRVPSHFYSFFIPVGWAFVIWLLIFMWETAFVIYQALPTQRTNAFFAAISPFWLTANVCQILWCFVFCPYAKELLYFNSLFLAGVAVSLAGCYFIFTGNQISSLKGYGWGSLLLCQVPLTIHFGWISAAVLVSINSLLVRFSFPLSTQYYAANASLLVAGLLGVGLSISRRDALYSLTLAWAANGLRCGTQQCLQDAECNTVLSAVGAGALERLASIELVLTIILLSVAGALALQKVVRYLRTEPCETIA